MKNYVISLTTASNRREHIIQEFGKHNIPFEFFDAITPPLSRLQELAKKFGVDIHDCNLSESELGCFFSHVCLWQKAIDENLDYIAIFEDDIYLSSDAKDFLTSSNWIPSNCDFIKIEKVYNKLLSTNKKIKIHQNHTLFKLQSEHVGAGGYIMSISMVKYALQYIQHNKADHIDQLLFNHLILSNTMPVYQLNPVICIQDCILYPDNQKFNSHLQWRDKLQEQIKNQPKVKLPLLKKIARELSRPFIQFYHFIFTINIQFKG